MSKRNQELYQRAKEIIPGGTQLLSKRPEMFLPNRWPAYFSKSKDCLVWDLEGNMYTDMSHMSVGSMLLGYTNSEVNDAVIDVISKGTMTTLNAPEEVELTELLLQLHPWAGMARYAKTGGEAMAIAVRIARAKTKKDKVLFSGYHGWSDWYLASNIADKGSLDGHLLKGLSPAGVPRGLKSSSFPFKFNDPIGFAELVEEHKNEVGAIVIEPIRGVLPTQEFISTVRETANKYGIVLIVDEITAGWRFNVGGAHMILGIDPDIVVFSKAMSNGYPVSAILGKNEVMTVAEGSFISSTYFTDRIGFVAAINTIKLLEKYDVPSYLENIGNKIQRGWKDAGLNVGLDINVYGMPALSHFDFNYPDKQALKTLFTKLMLDRGFLATTYFYASYGHKEEHIDKYIVECKNSFEIIKNAIDKGNILDLIDGEICHSGFQRLTH